MSISASFRWFVAPARAPSCCATCCARNLPERAHKDVDRWKVEDELLAVDHQEVGSLSIQNVLKLLRGEGQCHGASDTPSPPVLMSVRRKDGRRFVDFDFFITRCAQQSLTAMHSPGACEQEAAAETEDDADEMFELMRYISCIGIVDELLNIRHLLALCR
jgi:hypothetical protein